MTIIKRVFVFIMLLILLPAAVLVAQDSTETESLDPLQPGSKALQFQISENFNLESFSGSMFSYKKQVSNDRARRIGVGLSNRLMSSRGPTNETRAKSTVFNFYGNASYTWMTYTNPESDIKFYYGYGPAIGFGIYRSNSQVGENVETTTRSLSFTAQGLGYIGVEWFFHSSMSLHAEYGGSIRISHSNTKNRFESSGDAEVDTSNLTSLRLGGDGVTFGLSVYF